jgi:hypothetical protein
MVIIPFCLFNQQLYNLKKVEHENAQWGRDLLMSSATVCPNPLGPPVNLWTSATIDQQFVLSVHSVKFVSVVSPVSLHSEPKCHIPMNVQWSPILISVP